MDEAVVDASVSIKWIKPNEPDFEQANRLLTDYHNGHLVLFAPAFWEYELANGVNKAIAQGILSEEEGQEALEIWLGLGIILDPFPTALEAYAFSRRYKRSVYDSLYVSLAEQKGCDLWTGDRKLYNALNTQFSFVKWIGDY